MSEQIVVMYRPTGSAEMALVAETDYLRWPPRLPGQGIFYPVTNERYASEIAEQWNVKESSMGYVTRFSVEQSFAMRYAIHQVGASYHTEWWIPATELQLLNNHIVGRIEVVRVYH